MKILFSGLIAISIAFATGAQADVLGDEDDAYIGFQMTIPLETESAGLFGRKNQYSLLVINQTDDIRDGVAFTLYGDGAGELSYITPTRRFELGSSRLSEHSLPIMRFTPAGLEDHGYATQVMDGTEFVILLVAGTVVIMDKFKDTVESLDEIDAEDDAEAE